MAMPEAASMAIIIAGGVPDELTATLARVAVQVRQPFLDRVCAGQAFRRALCELGLTSKRGLETDADR
jgi:hypothetical protein